MKSDVILFVVFSQTRSIYFLRVLIIFLSYKLLPAIHHWLPIRKHIEYRVAALVWRYHQVRLRPIYLWEQCCMTSGIQGCHPQCFTEKGVLLVSFARTATMKNRAYSVVGPVVWNALPLDLRLHTETLSESFLNKLKTVLPKQCVHKMPRRFSGSAADKTLGIVLKWTHRLHLGNLPTSSYYIIPN